MRFYCLHEGFYESVQLRLDQLKTACEKLNIKFIALNSLTIDYSNLPTLTKADLLYNAARGSETLETLLLNKEVTTFYINNPDFVVANPDTTKYSIIHKKANLSSPKTIFNVTSDRKLLNKYVDCLGGFPIIIKSIGSTRGIGTIKIDSWHTLFSISDYLQSIGAKFIMRQFIKNNGAARIVVLKDEIIASDFRYNLDNDFRVSSDTVNNYYQKTFNDAANELAINATRLANMELAGVDIIFNENDIPYLLEINLPFNFIITAKLNKVDIANLMIEYLAKKATL